MASIVTENLKQNLIQPVIDDIRTGTSPAFYLGIGKSNAWANANDSAPNPLNNVLEENNFRRNLQSVIKINTASFVVKRYNWTTNTVYTQYDDTKLLSDYPESEPFYVMNLNQSVYMCLQTGRNAAGDIVVSTVEPTSENVDPFGTSDGYIWKYLYTVSALDANFYMTQNFIPVGKINSVDSNSTGTENKQFQVQQNAQDQMITSFVVMDSGSSYSANCKINVNGVYDPFINVTVNAGKISKVEYHPDSSTFHYRSNLDGAVLQTNDSTGSGAIIRPIFSTGQGVGANAINDLKSESILINSKIIGNQSDFITSQDFRQIGIIKGLRDSSNGTFWTQNTGQCLYSMTLDSIGSSFTKDGEILGATSGAKAWVDNVDGSTIHYHQYDSTGFLNFVAGEVINEVGSTGSGKIASGSAKILPEVSPRTGEILYIDNKSAIVRTVGQTEDIKIVVKLDNCS